MKKYLFIILSGLFLAACASVRSSTPEDLQELNFGAINSVDVLPIIIAEENGYFAEEGLTVNYEGFNSSNDRDSAFISGQLDGMICDIVAITLYQNGGTDVKITGVTDGDFNLIARQGAGIEQVNDLVGQHVAISDNTLIEYSLDRIVVEHGLEVSEVVKTIVPAVPVRLEMLRNDQVDAALLPEPFSTLAINEGAIVLGSANKEGFYPSVSAFSQDAIDEKSEEIKRFYRAYDRAVDYLNETPIESYEDIIIDTVGYAKDMRGSIELPNFRKNQLPSDDIIEDVISWVKEKGLIEINLTPEEIVNSVGIE